MSEQQINPQIVELPRESPCTFLDFPFASDLDNLEAEIAILGIPFGMPYTPGAMANDQSRAPNAIRQFTNKSDIAYTLSHFDWLSGQQLLTTYVGKHGYGLQFCKVCGSTLCGVFNGQIHGVTLGCLNGGPELELSRHIYVGSKAKWETIPDGVRQYSEGSE